MCDFLDLPFDDAMLSYHERAAERMSEMSGELEGGGDKQSLPAGQRAEMHAATSEPPKRESLEKWKREMASADVAKFEEIAGDLLAELGYETSLTP